MNLITNCATTLDYSIELLYLGKLFGIWGNYDS